MLACLQEDPRGVVGKVLDAVLGRSHESAGQRLDDLAHGAHEAGQASHGHAGGEAHETQARGSSRGRSAAGLRIQQHESMTIRLHKSMIMIAGLVLCSPRVLVAASMLAPCAQTHEPPELASALPHFLNPRALIHTHGLDPPLTRRHWTPWRWAARTAPASRP